MLFQAIGCTSVFSILSGQVLITRKITGRTEDFRCSYLVSYTVLPSHLAETGDELQASARVLFNTAPPEETATLVLVLDATATPTFTVRDVVRPLTLFF